MRVLPKVLIESPYRNVDRAVELANEQFALDCCRAAIAEGVAPFASHLFYTRFLDDRDEMERGIGIDAGLSWGGAAVESWFCFPGPIVFSDGMAYGLLAAKNRNRPCRYFILRNDGLVEIVPPEIAIYEALDRVSAKKTGAEMLQSQCASETGWCDERHS